MNLPDEVPELVYIGTPMPAIYMKCFFEMQSLIEDKNKLLSPHLSVAFYRQLRGIFRIDPGVEKYERQIKLLAKTNHPAIHNKEYKALLTFLSAGSKQIPHIQKIKYYIAIFNVDKYFMKRGQKKLDKNLAKRLVDFSIFASDPKVRNMDQFKKKTSYSKRYYHLMKTCFDLEESERVKSLLNYRTYLLNFFTSNLLNDNNFIKIYVCTLLMALNKLAGETSSSTSYQVLLKSSFDEIEQSSSNNKHKNVNQFRDYLFSKTANFEVFMEKENQILFDSDHDLPGGLHSL